MQVIDIPGHRHVVDNTCRKKSRVQVQTVYICSTVHKQDIDWTFHDNKVHRQESSELMNKTAHK